MRVRQESSFLAGTAIGTVLLFASIVLVGCGGSSSDGGDINPPSSVGGTSPAPPVPPVPTSPPPPDPVSPAAKPVPVVPPTVTPGVPPPPPVPRTLPKFEASTVYQNRCVFPEKQGERYGNMLDEMHYLRSWSYETQLWHYDIKEVDQSNYAKPKPPKAGDHLEYMRTYFDTLKPSFKPNEEDIKVPFHHVEFATENQERHDGQIDPYIGLSWRVIKGDVPREIRVLRVEKGSPAAASEGGVPKVDRGDKLLKFNGIDVVNANGENAIYDINQMIQDLWKLNKGDKLSYEFESADGSKTKKEVLTAERNVLQPIPHKKTISTSNGKVAYLALDSLQHDLAEKPLNEQFKKFHDEKVSDLILDLRHNPGGSVYLAAQLGYMIAGDDNTKNKFFAKLKLNYDAEANSPPKNKIPLVPIEFGKECQSYSTYDCDDTVIDNLYSRKYYSLELDRVFILISNETCGASEALINGLRGADVEVILIGTNTCGLIYGSLPETNCGITYYGVQVQVKNGKDFGEYADGFTPSNTPSDKGVKVKGCYVEDDLTKKVGTDDDTLLKAALQYRKDESCPAAPSSVPSYILTNGSPDDLGDLNRKRVTTPPKKWYGFNMDITKPTRQTN